MKNRENISFSENKVSIIGSIYQNKKIIMLQLLNSFMIIRRNELIQNSNPVNDFESDI